MANAVVQPTAAAVPLKHNLLCTLIQFTIEPHKEAILYLKDENKSYYYVRMYVRTSYHFLNINEERKKKQMIKSILGRWGLP